MTTETTTEKAGPTAAAPTARSLTLATAFSLGLRLAGLVVGMTSTAILARYLEPGGYGQLSLAITLATGVAQVADMGLALTVASRIANHRGTAAGSILSTGLALRTTAALIATAGLLFAAALGAFEGSGTAVAIVALSVPLSAASILTAGSTAKFRPEIAAGLSVLQGVLWLGAVVLASSAGYGLLWLACAQVVVVILQTATGVLLNKRVIPLTRPSTQHLGAIAKATWPLAISGLATMAYYRIDSLILFHARGAEELGFYSAAYKFIDVAQIIPALVVAPLLPMIARNRDNPARKKVIFSLASRTGVTVGIGTAAMLAVLAGPITTFVYGDAFEPAMNPLRWLGLAFVGMCMGYIGSTTCIALGRVKALAVQSISIAVVSLAVQFWATDRWGAAGAAATSAFTELAIGLGTLTLAARGLRTKAPITRLLAICAVGLLATAAGASFLDRSWILAGAVTVAMLGAGLLVTRAITVTDVKQAVSRRAL
ncbi:flippase [Paractinoplanes maris]|uniref:flippase n=1 Tax=Paractinoplanes maris TaxID=1734446 RepID=UPI0020209BCE|nr:flippase [Actinoplanes maris]